MAEMHKLRKRQASLVLSEVTYCRAAALAIIRNETMAEIWRLAVEGGGLRSIEEQHSYQILRLNFLADRLGIQEGGLMLAEMMLRDKHKMSEAWFWEKYPEKGAAAEETPANDTATEPIPTADEAA